MRIHHLAFRTPNVTRLEAFYRDVVGLTVVSRPRYDRVWLSADGTLVMIEPREEGEPDVPEGSKELVAFAIEAKEREPFLERLRSNDVPLEAETTFTLYFRDPDGRRVALSHYPSPSPA